METEAIVLCSDGLSHSVRIKRLCLVTISSGVCVCVLYLYLRSREWGGGEWGVKSLGGVLIRRCQGTCPRNLRPWPPSSLRCRRASSPPRQGRRSSWTKLLHSYRCGHLGGGGQNTRTHNKLNPLPPGEDLRRIGAGVSEGKEIPRCLGSIDQWGWGNGGVMGRFTPVSGLRYSTVFLCVFH